MSQWPVAPYRMDNRLTALVGGLWGIITEFLYDDGMLGTVLAFILVFGGAASAVLLLVIIAGLLA